MTSDSSEFDAKQVEQEAMRVLDEFVRSTDARETEAHVAVLHHPHYRLAQGEMTIWETEEDSTKATAGFLAALANTDWHRTGWTHRRMVHVGESMAHVDGRFVRLREDGSEIDTHDVLYVLTKQDGRWGIKLRSSFF